MSASTINLQLYVVTDSQMVAADQLPKIVEEAILGGATIIQYREKTLCTREMVKKARQLSEICQGAHIPFIINDRVDVALAVGADGVHLGQDDMAPQDARRILGPQALIGWSIRSVQQAIDAVEYNVNYVAANGIWDTSTKTDHGIALGLDKLRELVLHSPLPLVAIGGISQANAHLVAQTGAKGIAVVSAVMKAPNPKKACEALREAFNTGRV